MKRCEFQVKLSIIRDISRRFSPPTTPEELQQIQQILREEGIDFQNFYQELEMSDPYVETHRDVSYSNGQLHLHSHTFYQVLFIIITKIVGFAIFILLFAI